MSSAKYASKLLMALGCGSAVAGVLWMIWAGTLGTFDATRLPVAVTFSGIVVGVVGAAISWVSA